MPRHSAVTGSPADQTVDQYGLRKRHPSAVSPTSQKRQPATPSARGTMRNPASAPRARYASPRSGDRSAQAPLRTYVNAASTRRLTAPSSWSPSLVKIALMRRSTARGVRSSAETIAALLAPSASRAST